MVLLVLAVLWAVVLVPPALRWGLARTQSSSVEAFRRQLAVIERTGARGVSGFGAAAGQKSTSNGGSAFPAAAPSPVQQRRRDLITVLLIGAALTFAVALATGSGKVWLLQFLFDGLLLAYVAALAHLHNRRTPRQVPMPSPVRVLPQRRQVDPAQAPSTADLLLQRETGS